MKSIPVARPELGRAEADAAAEVILSGWVTQGPRVEEFEADFAKQVGAAHACAVSSCTTALQYALIAVGVRPGDTVLTVSHSFIATANAIRHCGAEPVFLDIDPQTLNMDPGELEQALAEDYERRDDCLYYKHVVRLAVGDNPLVGRKGHLGRLGAVLVVHQAGMPADMQRILSLTSPQGVPVVEDAACAIGSEILHNGVWQPVGRPLADAACFSFHPRKVITTGDGGMVTTSSAEHDRLFRLLRQHGMSVSDAVRHASLDILFEEYVLTGYNGRMTDIQAAVGIEQLKRLPTIIARRRQIAAMYHEALHAFPGLRLLQEPDYARTNWQSYVVFLDDPDLQRPVMHALLEKGISTRRGIMCAHLEAPYATAWHNARLNHSKRARDTGVILPLFPAMTDTDVYGVAEGLRSVLTGMS